MSRSGEFCLVKDIYDLPFNDRATWDKLTTENWYANEFVKNLVVDFYKEWYCVFNIDWWFRVNICERKYELVVRFDYIPEIKPNITECFEYMIEQLAA